MPGRHGHHYCASNVGMETAAPLSLTIWGVAPIGIAGAAGGGGATAEGVRGPFGAGGDI